MFNRITSAIKRHSQYRRTVNELARLTDRELHDLGIGRGQIPAIAKKEIF